MNPSSMDADNKPKAMDVVSTAEFVQQSILHKTYLLGERINLAVASIVGEEINNFNLSMNNFLTNFDADSLPESDRRMRIGVDDVSSTMNVEFETLKALIAVDRLTMLILLDFWKK